MRTVYPLPLPMPNRLRTTLRSIAARLLPSACALCGAAAADGLCGGCEAQFFRRRPTRCARCANLLPHQGGGAVCGACLKAPPAFDATWVAADYVPPVDQLVLALKFGHSLALAPLLARQLHMMLPPSVDLPQMLLPVPLALGRLAERGFNQSLEIARHLSRLLAIPFEPRLAIRTRETATQSLLPLPARRDNVRRAFTLDGAVIGRIRGQHVGLVDDVMTTGETLNELAAVCKRFGAARVTNLVFARALP
ncbi:MAG: ComF family protein [Burkholderiaceae bacterium]|nr:ComF family protein [Burkholderiaceae bacterium]